AAPPAPAAAPARLDRWQKRWDSNQLGWHLTDVNPFLRRYLAEMLPPQPGVETPPGMGRRVLVPLCGATVDMAFLARQGFRVVGVDGVAAAFDRFAEEHAIQLPSGGRTMVVTMPPAMSPERFEVRAAVIGADPADTATRTEAAPPVILVRGDFLELGAAEAEALVPFDAALDRASLVAIAPADRPRYAEVLAGLLAPGGRVLLVTCEHAPFADGVLGPPFQVTEADVRAHFGGAFDVRLLCREDTIDSGPMRMRDRGLDHFYEAAYLLTRRAP
ncbi:unnamed protein product, partial [Prorocentrum cordatum]